LDPGQYLRCHRATRKHRKCQRPRNPSELITGKYASVTLVCLRKTRFASECWCALQQPPCSGSFFLTRSPDHIADAQHQIAWAHDLHGRIIRKTQTVGSVSKSVAYGYTLGQLTSMTLPSGRVVTYGYKNNRVIEVSVSGVEVVTEATYSPYGNISGWTWGTGTTASRSYDLDGKPASINSAGVTTYSYDNGFRITGIADVENSSRSWTYGHDALDRVTSAARSGFLRTGLTMPTVIGLRKAAHRVRLTTSHRAVIVCSMSVVD